MRKTRLLSILALLLVAATGAWAQVGTPLTLEAKTAGTIQVENPQNRMKYSKNGGAKTVMTTTQTIIINVAVGDKVQFYGDGTSIPQYNGTHIEGGDAECYIYGNIMSLVDENGFATATALSEQLTFNALFYGNENLYNHPTNKLVLPATTLTEYCYYSMFAACRSMTSAPELPATTLAEGCYAFMFNECSSLTSAPELPATTLAEVCYYSMFYNCNSLTSAPELPATTLAEGCYYSMFKSCELLNSVTCLATNISAESSTEEWLADVAATGTFTKAPGMGNWETGISGIPEGWTTKDYSPEPAATYTVALAANTPDSASWQAKVSNAEAFSVLPLQDVAEDDSVTLTYNGNLEVMSVKVVKKAAGPAYPLLSAATTSDLGKVVCADGHLHDAMTAVPASCTAVGILGKVSETGHGLILALKEATNQQWTTINGWTSVTTYASTTLKLLPDDAARGANLTSHTTLGETAVSNWAVGQKSDYEAIFTNLGSTTGDSGGTTYDANVNAYITTGVGGTAISDKYWSATIHESTIGAWAFDSNNWQQTGKAGSIRVRPVLGF